MSKLGREAWIRAPLTDDPCLDFANRDDTEVNSRWVGTGKP